MSQRKHFSIIFLLTVVLGTLSGCAAGKATGTGTDDTGDQTPSNTCTDSVLDYGQKGIVAAVARGTYSDVGLIPGTASPVVAYSDAGSLSLKLNYWNGTSFITEIIAGDGTATFVKIAFLSSGIPIVIWAQGINVKMAIRSASLTTTSATWKAGVIDTGTAPRSLEISVNPLDQIGIVFVTDTAVTGRVKFLYCNSPCTSPSSFQSMTSTPYIENTNVIAATTGAGIAWCKASATSYFPAISYAVTAGAMYAICQNTLENCLTNTNWTLQSVDVVSATSSKLLLNSTVTGDIPKLILQAGSGIIPYQMDTTACTDTPIALTAGAAIGSATSGSQWQKVIVDSTGIFHLFANEGTTSARYYNSQTTTFNGAWNTAGIVETTTIPAASGGGIAYDSGTQSIYTSYPQGVAPFDLRLGRVQNITTASSAATFSRYTPDGTGAIQLAAANSQVMISAMATTSAGIPAVVYADYSIGAVASGKLKLSTQVSTTDSSKWSSILIPGTLNPAFPSLAFDKYDRPWIGYFDTSSNRFFLVTNTQTNGGGTWASYEFPTPPLAAPAALPMANQVAVAMMYSGDVSNPVMIVTDNAVSGRGVKVSTFDISTLSWSSVITLDTIVSGASNLTAAFETSGVIALAFRDLFSNRVKFYTSTNGTTWSNSVMLGSVGQGAGLSLQINPYNGHPALAYFDRANNQVIYNECSSIPSGCVTSGWSSTLIDTSAGISGLAAGNEQLLSTGLTFDSAGIPTVYYPTGQSTLGSLRSGLLSSGTFSLSTVLAGLNGNLPGTAAVNYSIAGWGVKSTTNSSYQKTITYLGPGNWLYKRSCGY